MRQGDKETRRQGDRFLSFVLLFIPTFSLVSLSPCLLVSLSSLSLGCHSLKLSPPVVEKLEKADKGSVPIAPAKYQLRVSQYLFLADFELKRDLALFRELADLREQVQKELQLPSADTLIQVHLFE